MPCIRNPVEATADYYATLGVGPEAEFAAIRVAYRNLMRRYHPDVNGTAEAAAKATEINAAYACLSDPDERAFYDRLREARRSRPSFSAAGATASPSQPQRPGWQRQHAYMADVVAEPPSRKWKVVSLGLATIVTIVTFKITSEVTGIVVPPPPAMVVVETPAPPATPCKAGSEPGGRDCTGRKPSATR